MAVLYDFSFINQLNNIIKQAIQLQTINKYVTHQLNQLLVHHFPSSYNSNYNFD